jgi:hypothetical protein
VVRTQPPDDRFVEGLCSSGSHVARKHHEKTGAGGSDDQADYQEYAEGPNQRVCSGAGHAQGGVNRI